MNNLKPISYKDVKNNTLYYCEIGEYKHPRWIYILKLRIVYEKYLWITFLDLHSYHIKKDRFHRSVIYEL